MFQAIAESILTVGGGRDSRSSSISQQSTVTKRCKTSVTMTDESVAKGSHEPEQIIHELKNELKIKDSLISSLGTKVERLEDEIRNQIGLDGIVKRQHMMPTVTHIIQDRGVKSKVQVGTRGSVKTEAVLQAVADPVKTEAQLIAEKFIQVFHNPVDHMAYLQSTVFSTDLIRVCMELEDLLECQPRCLFMQSPVYVFGDIHGNLEDLHFFADNMWKLGMDLTAGKFLFLGDYVDRGMNSLECVAYLFGLKLLYPNKIHLLRGNHETRDVNGWEEHYGERSFIYQCKDRFGRSIGESVWEECNHVFDRLPLSAVIDHEIFCCHGGIPRPIDGYQNELEAILDMPNVASVMPAYDHEEPWMKQVAADCLWSDPASNAMEAKLDEDGFGVSPRGGGAVCFGSNAVDNFLNNNGLSYIIRAHEAHSHGVTLSKGARVFTVFSTSKDHKQGSRAMAGCILVDFDIIQVINRSPKYKNKYVHRRTSASLRSLSSSEIDQRSKLGLIRTSAADAEYYRLKREMELDEERENRCEIDESNNNLTANNLSEKLHNLQESAHVTSTAKSKSKSSSSPSRKPLITRNTLITPTH